MQAHRIRETTRTWFAGVAVTLTTIVAYFAFWHLSPTITFAIGCIALLGLTVTAWLYGRRLRLDREKEKSPQQPSAREASPSIRRKL